MIHQINTLYPVRYTAFALCVFGFALSVFAVVGLGVGWLALLVLGALVLLGVYDLRQTRHAILRNYPVIGHLRFMLEYIRPEIRQYFIESDREAAPFSRAQRSLVYQRAKGEPDNRPFGTQLDVGLQGYEWINHSMAPTKLASHDFRVWVGGTPDAPSPSASPCTQPYSLSVFNISAMSFGALSANAILALNRGDGGVLPGPKVTPEIAAARGVPVGQACISPSQHSAFSTPVEMMQLIARMRTLSGGKPTGFKLCIGHPWEWFAIVKAMLQTGITPDFIVVDGAEGGTGAAPVEFSDHVGAPLQEGLLLVHNTLRGVGLRERVRIGCAGKVISAFDVARMMALGADWCNSARGFMMALGCLQAQTCHSGHCPTGVATQDPVRQQALVVPDKAQRVAQFHQSTLHALQELVQAAGLQHPQEITAHHIVRRISDTEVRLLSNLILRVEEGALLGSLERQNRVFRLYWPLARADSFQPATDAPDSPRDTVAQRPGLNSPQEVAADLVAAQRAAGAHTAPNH